MSTHSPQLHSLSGIDRSVRIALVVGEFNRHQTERLELANIEFLEQHGFSDIMSFLVPGAFEIPGMIGRLLETDSYGLIIALGVVVR